MRTYGDWRGVARHRTQRRLLLPFALIGLVAAPLTALATPASAAALAFQNGSFELGSFAGNTSGIMTLSAGSTVITGWQVTTGTVDWIENYWTAENGNRSLDMNGTGPGSIAQTFATTPAHTYSVTFYLAANTNCLPTIKTLNVDATGGTMQSYTFDGTNDSNLDMGWTAEEYTFTASRTSTTLTFSAATGAGNDTECGPALDNVSVTAATGSGNGETGTGAACKAGSWQRLTDPATGFPYANQGQCVSDYATSGDTPGGA